MMTYLVFVFIFSLLGPSEQLHGIQSPQDLDHIIVEVNGQVRKLPLEATLHLVQGDMLRFRKAILVSPDQQAQTINLQGFRSIKSSNASLEDDRGDMVDTAKDLKKGWSIRRKGEVYKVIVNSGKQLHGKAFIHIIKPELRYAVLQINGNRKVLDAGDQLRVKDIDRVKVEQIVTNLGESYHQVSFRIEKSGKMKEGRMPYDIKFLLKDRQFANISLLLEVP